MILRSVSVWSLLLLPLAVLLNGCYPAGHSRWDEEKDPYYLAGKNRVGSLDYDGAIEAFEKALESNPRSASAHLELGILNEERKKNYARAIYHFEKHLELRPNSNYAEMVNQHIIACKLELARTVSFALVSHQVQDEIRNLNSTNTFLRGLVERLRADLASQAVTFSNRLASLTSAPNVAGPRAVEHTGRQTAELPVRQTVETRRTPALSQPLPNRFSGSSLRPLSTPRIHFIAKGDTLASISRRYGVSLEAVRAANPGVDPRRLRVGQAIRLPARRN